jgi:hypothetical protein
MTGMLPAVLFLLKEKFSDLVILTPGSPEYEENMLRWNVAAEHKAVGPFPFHGGSQTYIY